MWPARQVALLTRGTEIKTLMDWLNRKKEGTEERISELKDKTIKTNLSNRETTILKKKKLETCGTLTKDLTFTTSESWKKRRRQIGWG